MSMGISAAAYHAGLDPKVKDQIQRDWKKEKTRIIVATNAFGMGIDKANVRTVIHFDIPDSIEAYFQEAGRAGRDGLRAFAVLVYNNADLLSMMDRIEKAFPSIEVIKKVYTGICSNYQLAYGSGINQSFVFDIIALSEVIKIPVLDVFNSLKILERVGYIQLSDSLHKPARLKIKVSQSDLYYFEVANPKFELLLKTLLRSYSGLFDNHVVVNEYLIAKRVQTNVEDLLKQLKYLDKIELLEYLPASDKPQITFLVERLPEDRLTISYESYGALKKKQLERGRSMTEFVSSSKCRHVQLLEYFGEKDVKNCGKCDVCLKSKTTSAESKILENKVKSLIQQGGKTIEMILSELAIKDEEQIIEIIRYFADEGLIQRDSNNFWKWVA
jgi:ATP-dependent DNA helicase RecQ